MNQNSSLLDLFKESTSQTSQLTVLDSKSWDKQMTRSSQHEYSYEEINSHVNKGKRKSQSTKGWKTIDGKKEYTTFRHGGKVVVTGRDAFLLARSDNGTTNAPKNRKKKEAGSEVKISSPVIAPPPPLSPPVPSSSSLSTTITTIESISSPPIVDLQQSSTAEKKSRKKQKTLHDFKMC